VADVGDIVSAIVRAMRVSGVGAVREAPECHDAESHRAGRQ
jgi:hypothetical protein